MKPKIVEDYIAAAKAKAEADKQLKALRPAVLEELKLSDGWDDCYTTTSKSMDVNEDLLYEWVKKEYPDLISELTRHTVDWEKFMDKVNLKEIDIFKVPKSCIVVNETTSINTSRKRKP